MHACMYKCMDAWVDRCIDAWRDTDTDMVTDTDIDRYGSNWRLYFGIVIFFWKIQHLEEWGFYFLIEIVMGLLGSVQQEALPTNRNECQL